MWTNLILGGLQIYFLVLLSIGADIYLKKYLIFGHSYMDNIILFLYHNMLPTAIRFIFQK